MFWATDSAIKKRITHDCQLYSSASFGEIVTETDSPENSVSCLGPDFFLTREVVGLIFDIFWSLVHSRLEMGLNFLKSNARNL